MNDLKKYDYLERADNLSKMKKRFFFILFLFYIGIPQSYAQDLLDALRQTAEMHNEQRGESNRNETELSPEERQRLLDYWNEQTEEARDFIDGLNKPYHQCLALLGIFSYQMITLFKAAEEEENCKMKYDYLGLQSLMLTGGMTLMPCTEELSELGTFEKQDLMDEFYSSLFSCNEDNGYKWTPLAEKAPNVVTQILVGFFKPPCHAAGYSHDSDADLRAVLYTYFKPESYIKNIIDIGQQMEALGCGG